MSKKYDNVADGSRYQSELKKIEDQIKEENKKSDKFKSESKNKYTVDYNYYSMMDDGSEVYSEIVFSDKDGEIARFNRDMDDGFLTWIVDHPDGNDYVIFEEMCQGYAVLNLTTREVRRYFPKVGGIRWAYRWAEAVASPNKTVLAVYMSGVPGRRLAFYDISNMESFPLVEVGTLNPVGIEDGYSFDYFDEWVDDVILPVCCSYIGFKDLDTPIANMDLNEFGDAAIGGVPEEKTKTFNFLLAF